MAGYAAFVSSFLVCAPLAAQPADPRPLSPAQVALFMTPHLQNVERPETLEYSFTRRGPVGFTDSVAVHVREVHPDGTRDVAFDFLTGERRENYPSVGEFRGNPLLMVFLEHDVKTMRESIGISGSYFRNRIREAFVDGATIEDVTATVDGSKVPARKITLRPFQNDERLVRLPPIRNKTYTFVLADAVPGGIVEISTDMAADAGLGVPAAGEQVVFNRAVAQGAKP